MAFFDLRDRVRAPPAPLVRWRFRDAAPKHRARDLPVDKKGDKIAPEVARWAWAWREARRSSDARSGSHDDGRGRGTSGLLELFSRAPWRTDALDLFVGQCLTSGGVWTHPRTSDGIPNIDRVLDRGADGIGVCARIYEIDDQSLHTFWLEIKRDAATERIQWWLYFDIIASSHRRAQDAILNADRPEDINWRATLSGEATMNESVLMVVASSTQVSLQETSNHELSELQRHLDDRERLRSR